MRSQEPDYSDVRPRPGPGVMLRSQSHGKILETHFDDPPQHARSASYSTASGEAGRPMSVNLNNSFPGTETASSSNTPYISSSVTLPAVSSPDPVGFYHNVSGRIRQPSLRHKEEARNSFARQADLHKSPRTQELEEFAAKFEGYQKQRTRRMATQPTPLMDQLARETAGGQAAAAQLWQLAHPEQLLQLSTLETNLLRLVQRNTDSRHRGYLPSFSDGDSSGRESVTTVISNSSSETVKVGSSSERHSSSETLRYCDTEAGDMAEAGPEAVRTRTMSICDEMFLGHGYGQGLAMPDNNYNTWRLGKPRPDTENNNSAYWDMNGGHQNGYGTVKRSLYRSHSEAGTVLNRNGGDTWQGEAQETPEGTGTTWHDLGEVGGPHDHRGQMLDYLARDEVTSRWLQDAQVGRGDNWPPASNLGASSGEGYQRPQELPPADKVSTTLLTTRNS